MISVYIVSAVFLLYLIFVIGPAIVAVFTVFDRRNGTEFFDLLEKNGQFGKHRDELVKAREILLSQKNERVTLKARDGTELVGYYYCKGSNKTAVFVHGYRSEWMSNFALQGVDFLKRGYDLLFVCQRAHGESGGKRSTLGIKESGDVEDWIKRLTDRGKGDIVVYGISMGAAAVAYASENFDVDRVKALVLDSGFSSPYSQIAWDCRKRKIPPMLLMPWIRVFARLFLGIDIKKKVASSLEKCRIPAFFLHGTSDETVLIEEGKRSFEHCASEKEMFITPGACHTAAYVEGGEKVKNTLFAFLKKYITENDRKKEIS